MRPFPAPPPVVGGADDEEEVVVGGGGLERGAFIVVGIMDGAAVRVEEVEEAGEESWLWLSAARSRFWLSNALSSCWRRASLLLAAAVAALPPPPPLVGSSTFILVVVGVVVLTAPAGLACPPWCVLLLLPLPFSWLLMPLWVEEDAYPAAPAVAVLIEAGGAATGAPSMAPATVLLASTMKDAPEGVAGVVLVLLVVVMVLPLLVPGPLRLLGIPIIVWWRGVVWSCAGKNLSPGSADSPSRPW